MRLKRLEQWWRRVWIRVLVRLMRRPPDDSAPDWGGRPQRLLFLRHDRAGDMILSTGVMRAIAQSHPTITMDVLASPANASILGGADYIGNVIEFDKKRLGSYLPTAVRLRRARYDAVIDCMVTAPSVTTLLLVLASGARYRVGIAGRGNDAAFNVTVPPATRPDAHMIDLLAALIPAFGARAAAIDSSPALVVTDEERTWAEAEWGETVALRVLINISAGTSERTWPSANYTAVMQHVARRAPGAIIRVIGSPGDAARAERIALAAGGGFVPTRTIRHAFALVAAADFVLTPDTSIAHAASAFDTPGVALFVRGKSERWGLRGSNCANVEHGEPTLETLGVDDVLRAVDQVLDRRLERGGVGNAALRQAR